MALLKDLRDMKALTPEERVFINEFYVKFNTELNQITNIEPLYFHGIWAGSELATYAANKVYLCLSIIFGCNDISQITLGNATFYDELNAINQIYYNNAVLWDSVANVPNYVKNKFEIRNIWFSRVNLQRYLYTKFIGYRVTFT